MTTKTFTLTAALNDQPRKAGHKDLRIVNDIIAARIAKIASSGFTMEVTQRDALGGKTKTRQLDADRTVDQLWASSLGRTLDSIAGKMDDAFQDGSYPDVDSSAFKSGDCVCFDLTLTAADGSVSRTATYSVRF